MPLMINDASQLQTAKVPKYAKQLSIEDSNKVPDYSVESVSPQSPRSSLTH